MNTSPPTSQGFSLVEMAIVLVIIGFLVGGMLMPLSAQIESGKIKQTQAVLEDVREALYGYAMVNGCLPCPATATAATGVENRNTTVGDCTKTCASTHGFVPVVTLGLSGNLNADNLLEDGWGNPLRYSVATSFSSTSTAIGWNTTADLVVCNKAPASPPVCDAGTYLIGPQSAGPPPLSASPAVVFSMGRNWFETPQAGEAENLGTTQTGPAPSSVVYPVASNNTFVKQDYGKDFDDMVIWLSTNILLNRLCTAGKKPC